MIALVPLGLAHAEVCAAVHAAAFAHPWQAKAFADLLALPTVRGVLAVEEGGAPVGLILVQVVAGEAEILTIGVARTARRRGVGRRLLDWALDGLRAEGGGRLFLEVAADNTAARALYGAAGFAEVALRRGYYEGGIDAVVMARDVEV